MRTIQQTAREAGDRDEYLDLVRRFPLRPLRTEAQYDQAGEIYSELADRAEAGLTNVDENDYLEVLGRLVDDYDEQHSSLLAEIRRRGKVDPIEILKTLMEANNLTNADMSRLLGIGSGHMSMILSGQRGLSKASIRLLADRFKLRADLLL